MGWISEVGAGLQREQGVGIVVSPARVSGSERSLRRVFLGCYQKHRGGVLGGGAPLWTEKEQEGHEVLLSLLQLCSQEWGHSLAGLSLLLR